MSRIPLQAARACRSSLQSTGGQSTITRCAHGQIRPAFRRPFSAATQHQEKKYTQDHEWIELAEDQKTGTIGVSTYAAKALGDVVYVELPQASGTFSAGDTIGAVESVKSASDIMTPIAGTIVEANALLEEKPGTINKSPEGEGWIAKIELGEKGVGELGALMAKAEYDKFTGEIAEGNDH